MTTNERLFEAGLADEFDQARREFDADRMIDLLSRVELADQAKDIVDQIIANPDRYDPDRLKNYIERITKRT
jgi:hypothetical protein